MEDARDDIQESSPEDTINAASSAEREPEDQVTEAATPQEAEDQTETAQDEDGKLDRFDKHPRFKQLMEERDFYRQQAEIARQQSMQQPQSFQAPQQPYDPYANMTPEEQIFWRKVDQIAEQKAQHVIQRTVSPQLQAGLQEMTTMKVEQFYKDHPDIQKGSYEEAQIAQRIRMGYKAEDAYWSVMGPRGVRQAETKVKQQQKQRVEAKRKANVETRTMSHQAPQSQPKSNLRETAGKYIEQWLKNEL